jgi:hypothetical protein
MRHRLAIILVALGAGGTLYAAWALHRASDAVLVRDMSWPRPTPYPDGWIAALNGWYDARHPASGDSLKLHGEFPRVRLTIVVILALGLWLLVVGVRMAAAQRHREPGRGA